MKYFVFSLKLAVFVIVSVIVTTNLLPGPQTPFEKARDQQNHLLLAKIFLENNDYVLAKQEFNLSGVNFISEPDKIKEEIRRWERLTLKYPNYRDGYVKLAILNWRIFQSEQVQFYLSKAQELDPNYPLPRLQ